MLENDIEHSYQWWKDEELLKAFDKEYHNYISGKEKGVTLNDIKRITMFKTCNSEQDENINSQEYNNDIDAAIKEMDIGEFTSHDAAKKSLLK